jgi:hypothetical protein
MITNFNELLIYFLQRFEYLVIETKNVVIG